MTLMYLKDINLMLALVSAARESNIETHLAGEGQLLNVHVSYARYNSYPHVSNILNILASLFGIAFNGVH